MRNNKFLPLLITEEIMGIKAPNYTGGSLGGGG